MVPYDQIANRKYEDVIRRIPDIEKARRVLGFEARVTLEDGLRKTIDWQRPFVTGSETIGQENAQMLAGAAQG
jgi:UDP-glucose 4-epimerase